MAANRTKLGLLYDVKATSECVCCLIWGMGDALNAFKKGLSVGFYDSNENDNKQC
jgi:hypothetical protein